MDRARGRYSRPSKLCAPRVRMRADAADVFNACPAGLRAQALDVHFGDDHEGIAVREGSRGRVHAALDKVFRSGTTARSAPRRGAQPQAPQGALVIGRKDGTGRHDLSGRPVRPKYRGSEERAELVTEGAGPEVFVVCASRVSTRDGLSTQSQLRGTLWPLLVA